MGVTLTVAGILLVPLSDHLPPLIRVTDHIADLHGDRLTGQQVSPYDLEVADLDTLATENFAVFPGLTPWYYAFSTIPLVTCLVATWAATRRATRSGGIGIWLVIALALLAGAQLHSVFWPSFYGPLLSTTSMLRLMVAMAVLVGGTLELRRVIQERDVLLVAEQERTQRLEDIAQLKADFTSIVAHELANPVAAIKAMSEMVALDDLPDDLRRRTAGEIAQETRMLEMLIQDIRETATIERDDFRVDLRRIPVDRLVSEARAHANRLPGAHPVTLENSAATLQVLCDPDRVGQVMRNLLNNAARYTLEDTPISIRTRRLPGEVAFEVADRGPGIPPDDLRRIFEKFGRGQAASQSNASGRGLGLYLSRRIVRGHGSDLVVESSPSQGTVFRFTLKEVS
jgi:signal transduction histidine kinase